VARWRDLVKWHIGSRFGFQFPVGFHGFGKPENIMVATMVAFSEKSIITV
jgi:hypothetical protein